MTIADGREPAGPGQPELKAPRRRARSFVHLTRRADFVHVGKGSRYNVPAFTMLAASRAIGPAEAAEPRFGLTVTKKTGGAVERNRIRRRLREAIRLIPDLAARPGYDYVLVARREVLAAPFASLMRDLDRALRGIHDGRSRPARRSERRKPRLPNKAAEG